MKIRINGEEHSVSCTTLAQLLDHLEHQPASVATAVNHVFVPREDRDTCVLSENDAIDIIAPMSGG